MPPWFVVGFGAGIAAWFVIAGPRGWQAFLCVSLALVLIGLAIGQERSGRALAWFAFAAASGCALVWARSAWVASPRLDRPQVVQFTATVSAVDHLPARETVRLLLKSGTPGLPPTVRVSLDEDKFPAGIAPGAVVDLRARLAPPPPMALPGTYDFARDAWFKGIGAVGKTLGPVTVTKAAQPHGLDRVRDRLRRHIMDRLPGNDAGIAIAMATGDQNAVDQEDADAMRRSGLTHLLSVSGLHIAAVVAFAMFLTLKLLALSEWLALRFNLVLVAAAAGAMAGIGYTLLTGAQVPTVRSCVAALLVLAGIALGREAISIRLIATGALVVLIFRPEALAGPSFQMSFAAVTAIVAFHSAPWARWLLERREEGLLQRIGRSLLGVIATGVAVECALIPIALFHFHRAGLYGVAANILAIPLTTFLVMPLEAGALILDGIGLGRPLWFLCGLAIKTLLALAHVVGSARGAIAMMPSMPGWSYALLAAGGLWICLWTTRARRLGLLPIAVGAAGALAAPAPDLLITGDGRHLAIADAGEVYILRDRAGDYIRSLLAEASGYDGDPSAIDAQSTSDCTYDACLTTIHRNGSAWHLLATRSATRIDWSAITQACASADIVISDRRLPKACVPRWLKLDAASLKQTGGLAITLADVPRIATVSERVGNHPWASRPKLSSTSHSRPRVRSRTDQ
ncbi:ComEC/Rec2 family competence protein [Sphingomonas flavescens]|uniref:ComEC/Rec2 family competence protein n=1 Tax=Sphingomonas flavescens TaxID=3132797 RepID=UPI002804F162|nr:ComEC/Rec2 family competence protein [Sphingomonas limnosediminicola]